MRRITAGRVGDPDRGSRNRAGTGESAWLMPEAIGKSSTPLPFSVATYYDLKRTRSVEFRTFAAG
jgi:hypothetical protein